MKNQLSSATSLYLRQHGENPVLWQLWSDEILHRAQSENKLIIVSIGYSSCHWCHVMEKESFEDEGVAEIMNAFYIPIKIDREESPDLDAFYMDALRLMRQGGGWPLNCICLPNGQPIYGGTYFPKEDWKNILLNLAQMWKDEPQKFIDYGKKLNEGVAQLNCPPILDRKSGELHPQLLKEAFGNWHPRFDYQYGGHQGAPKFPMPQNWTYLLRYGNVFQNGEALSIVRKTVKNLVKSGLFDPIEGAFFRYSTDEKWHIPHFEKMLYDNAQLLSLLAEYICFVSDNEVERAMEQTLLFLKEKMSDRWESSRTCFFHSDKNLKPKFARYYFASIDADSEGEEGKYYVWKWDELQKALGEDIQWFADFYQLKPEGNWEQGLNVLMQAGNATEWDEKIAKALDKLKQFRSMRKHPRIDEKGILAWNALMLKALTDIYKRTLDEQVKQDAYELVQGIYEQFNIADLGFSRIAKSEDSKAFLDDYAFLADALRAMYELDFEETFLEESKRLTERVIQHFLDEESGFFFLRDKNQASVHPPTFELSDNVVNASNSVMANHLLIIGTIYGKSEWITIAENMAQNMLVRVISEPSFHSNWLSLLLNFMTFKAVICNQPEMSNEDAKRQMYANYKPNVIFFRTNKSSQIDILKDKYVEDASFWQYCNWRFCSDKYSDLNEILEK